MEQKDTDFNEWWLSLSDGQRESWQDDKWQLAAISYRAGYMKGINHIGGYICMTQALNEGDGVYKP